MDKCLVALAVGLLFLCGCQSASPSGGDRTAAELLDLAAIKMESVTSFHFELRHEGGGTPLGLGLELSTARGDVVKPDKLATTIGAKRAKLFIEVKVVTVGDETYITNPLNGAWEAVRSDFKAISIFNPDSGIKSLLKGVYEPAIVGSEDVDGRACYRVRGKTAAKALEPFTLTYVDGAVVESELWIDKQEHLVRQLRLRGRITEMDPETVVRIVQLSRFDQPVDIRLPQ